MYYSMLHVKCANPKMERKHTYGEVLLKTRVKNGYTRTELAKEVNQFMLVNCGVETKMSASLISKYEANKFQPKADYSYALSHVLGVEESYAKGYVPKHAPAKGVQRKNKQVR